MSVSTVRDLTGQATTHRVTETLTVQYGDHWWLAPTHRPFYTESLVIYDPLLKRDLIPGTDFVVIHLDDDWTTRTEQALSHFIVLKNSQVNPQLEFTSQVLGGGAVDNAPTLEQLRNYLKGYEGFPSSGEQVVREVANPDIDDLFKLSKRITIEYVLEEADNIRRSLLEGNVEEHDEMMAYANDTKNRYFERVLELMQSARQAINEHVANKFAHNLTKDQIGLDKYPNYPVAISIVLEAGMSEGHLVTPEGLHEMIDVFALSPLRLHLAEEPAHELDKDDIGLSEIENFPPANSIEAAQGRKKDRYMTPGVTLEATRYQFNARLETHKQNGKAHALSKNQLSLGLYENYAVAGADDFEDYEATNFYFTPKTLYDFIKHHYWESQLSHVYDEDDPHNLTKDQLGLDQVDNVSRDQMDDDFAMAGHHHGFDELPFTEEEYNEWQAIASFVLDSRIITYQAKKTVWSKSTGPTTGVSEFTFPDNESNIVRQKNTVLKARNTNTGELEEKEGTVALTVEQVYDQEGNRIRKYSVDNATIWLECQRLFPPPVYAQHVVEADLYFTLELQEGLPGPEGVYFRPDGHYPWLRAQATTKGDVGLGNYPNKGPDWYDGRYAAKGHSHPGEGYAQVSWMDATFERRSAYSYIARDMRQVIIAMLRQQGYMNHSLHQLGTNRFSRAAPVNNPDVNEQFVATSWSVRKANSSFLNLFNEATKGTNGKQIETVPSIQANTGEWLIIATHFFRLPDNSIQLDHGKIVVDTGEPKNPADWVYECYRVVLGRGNNIYGVFYDNGGDWGTVKDPTGPNYWMNYKQVDKDQLWYDIAYTAATNSTGGDPWRESGKAKARDWLDQNYPDWHWGPWQSYTSPITYPTEPDANIVVIRMNGGGFDTDTVQYRNGSSRPVDPAADPIDEWEVVAERRKSQFYF